MLQMTNITSWSDFDANWGYEVSHPNKVLDVSIFMDVHLKLLFLFFFYLHCDLMAMVLNTVKLITSKYNFKNAQ